MEKKKLLWIAISVGIFLVMVVALGIAVFSPPKAVPPPGTMADASSAGSGSESSPAALSAPVFNPPSVVGTDAAPPENSAGSVAAPLTGNPAESPSVNSAGNAAVNPAGNPAADSRSSPVDAVGMVRASGDLPGLKEPPPESSGTGNNFHVSGSAQSGAEKPSGTIISVPKPSTAAVPDAAPAGRAVSPPREPVPQSAPVQTASPPQKSAAPASRPAPAVQTKVYDDYWVQTGAFSTVARAEGVKETLAAKGITSIVENRQVEGKTVFRVRVGPYTSQNEANYWLSLIKSIDGFETSLVMQTKSRR